MIKLRTFNLEKIDEIKHYSLIKILSNDKKVQQYIASDFKKWLKKQISTTDDKMEPGKSYVIEKDNKYIGIVGSFNLSDEGILELWCTIKKDEREKGNGEKVLAQVTSYLIENTKELKDIKLKIDKNNKASKKTAIRNGYIKVSDDEEFDLETYYYFNNHPKSK